LVNDVFIALQRAGNVKVNSDADMLGTPDSGIVRGSKRAGTGEHPFRSKGLTY
jgi:hypothetical protein